MTALRHRADVLGELELTLNAISPDEAAGLIDLIVEAGRIVVAGVGRSGLATRAFAMRLRHLGLEAYVAGETVTPNFTANDLLIAGSGSGETAGLVAIANRAKSLGGRVALVSIFPQSSLGRLSDLTVRIPAASPKTTGAEAVASVQPMGALFEQSLLVFFDLLVLDLMARKGIDSAAMYARHANLE